MHHQTWLREEIKRICVSTHYRLLRRCCKIERYQAGVSSSSLSSSSSSWSSYFYMVVAAAAATATKHTVSLSRSWRRIKRPNRRRVDRNLNLLSKPERNLNELTQAFVGAQLATGTDINIIGSNQEEEKKRVKKNWRRLAVQCNARNANLISGLCRSYASIYK